MYNCFNTVKQIVFAYILFHILHKEGHFILTYDLIYEIFFLKFELQTGLGLEE